MTALQIEEQKAFTENLFIGELFDRFLVREASFVTYNSFLIDGRVRQGYYSEEELELQKIEEFSAWKVLKPFCYSLIRGKRLPESFRIVFLLPPEETARFVAAHGAGLAAEQVQGLYLNVQYENHGLTCITGVSLNVFSMDRTLEREWDQAVREFLKKNGGKVDNLSLVLDHLKKKHPQFNVSDYGYNRVSSFLRSFDKISVHGNALMLKEG